MPIRDGPFEKCWEGGGGGVGKNMQGEMAKKSSGKEEGKEKDSCRRKCLIMQLFWEHLKRSLFPHLNIISNNNTK